GFELMAFNNRLSFDAVYYNKDTKGIIVTRPSSLGVKAGLSNAGEIRNNGFELSTSWLQKINENSSLTIGGNFTTMNNNVKRLVDERFYVLASVSITTVVYPIA